MIQKIYKNYIQVSIGHVKKSKKFNCPYVIGVDIDKNEEEAFLVAEGANRTDIIATEISQTELVSGKWKEHIKLSNGQDFIKQLKKAIGEGEGFPQEFIVEMVKE